MNENPTGHYKFTEMFDSDGKFDGKYRIRECPYMTYIAAFPADALIAPGPPQLEVSFGSHICTLGHFGADIVSVSSTITFFEDGMAKQTIKKYRDSKIVGQEEGWYDRQTSNALLSEFKSFNFEEWTDDFTGGRIMFDGSEWALTATYVDGTTKRSHGFVDENEISNWEQIKSFFALPSDFHRGSVNGTKEEYYSKSDITMDIKELTKFIIIYLVIPFICLILFMLCVWIYFGSA